MLFFHSFQSHADLNEDHKTLTIEEYRKQAGRLETRMCREHKDQVYSLGCGACLSVFCSSCITPHNICSNGKLYTLYQDNVWEKRSGGGPGRWRGSSRHSGVDRVKQTRRSGHVKKERKNIYKWKEKRSYWNNNQ